MNLYGRKSGQAAHLAQTSSGITGNTAETSPVAYLPRPLVFRFRRANVVMRCEAFHEDLSWVRQTTPTFMLCDSCCMQGHSAHPEATE